MREATDDQEGGQGARSRDEEGAMGPADNADRSNRYGIQGPGGEERSMAREQAAQAGALQALGGDVAAAPAPPPQPGYDMRGAPATATVAPAEPAAAIPPAVQAQVRALGYDIDQGARPPSPDPAPTAGLGTTGSGYGGGGSGEGTIGLRGPPRPMRRARASTSSEILDPFWAEGERPRGGGGRVGGVAEAQHRIVIETSPGQSTITTSTTRIVFDTTHHARARCSDAASLPLDDRRALWRERLGQAGHAYGWVEVYRAALRDCEAPDWRDRRALLDAILAQAGGVQSMIAVYGLFDSGAARGYLRSAILRRVRSPEELRAVRGAFGLGAGPDWTLVEQVLARAPNDEARLRALRQLVAQYPDDFDLKLRLLEMLETAERGPEARRLAERLRTDPRADAGVRTAIGELYLRMDLTEEARRVFSEIVEFAPLDELARRRLGDLYRAHGWFEDAYRQYETLSRIRPDDPSVLLLLAQAAAGAGRIDEALRLEQRLMETSEPGAERGIARVAMLWSSVRLAKLRAQAREASDEARLAALEQRMRRSGILREAGDLRVTLTWSHPDAQLSLWTAHPGRVAARPADLAPEHGLEAFDVAEQEDGDYRVEVRRADPTSPQPLEAELVLVWREGQRDEVVRVVPLAFREGREGYRWSLRGSELREIAD
ncbi:MAG: tetratricopeptide repeat protein [Sandaracinaceae bacterium]|nr:tetratricopeptide repeat protein [Sandaracinaceae bacterium]